MLSNLPIILYIVFGGVVSYYIKKLLIMAVGEEYEGRIPRGFYLLTFLLWPLLCIAIIIGILFEGTNDPWKTPNKLADELKDIIDEINKNINDNF